MAVPVLKLNNGFEIPAFGLGTYEGKGIKDVIKLSIDLGYRLIDTAFVYANEKEIGEGIAEKIEEGAVKREDLFVVTKLWNTKHKPEDVIPAMKRSLSDLGLTYVDLYLMHWPFACTGGLYEQKSDTDSLLITPRFTEFGDLIGSQGVINDDEYDIFTRPVEEDILFEDTWAEMEKCVEMGLAKSIGLSNFNSIQVDRILKIAKIKPVVNQVECNPYLNQEKLNQFCQQREILLMAYSPFYAPNRLGAISHGLNLFEEPLIKEIAGKYGKTSSQVILRYLTQRNVIPIPKSDNPERLKLNIDIFGFTLTEEELGKMLSLNKNKRCTCFQQVQDFKEYPFKIEF